MKKQSQTGPKLSQYDLDTVMPRVIEGLLRKKGQKAKSGEIVTALRKENYRINDQKLRAIVHHIRVNHIVRGLASSPEEGYWITQHPGTIRECVEALKSRVRSINEAADALAQDMVYFSQQTIPATR